MHKVVIFDCYNTLICYESMENKTGIWKMMLESMNYILDIEIKITDIELKTLYERAYERELCDCMKIHGVYAEVSLRRVWINVLTMLNIPYEIAEEKAEDILFVHRIFARKKRYLFPNVEEELIKLKKHGMKLFILSNAQTCFFYNELPRKIVRLFDDIIISEEMGIKKPSEELFCSVFKKIEVKPNNVIFIGDSLEDDIIPTKLLGCRCIKIGKQKNLISSTVINFNPYEEKGYTGLSDIIFQLI